MNTQVFRSLHRRLDIGLLSAALLACILLWAVPGSADSNIATGDPQVSPLERDGVTDVFTVTINGVTKNISITVRPTDDGIDKARKLANAINDRDDGFGPGSASQNKDDHGQPTNSVHLNGDSFARLRANGNTSREPSAEFSFLLPSQNSQFVAVFDATGIIAGTDLNGAQSTFAASFGWDGFSDQFTSNFTGLSGATADALLQDVYSQFRDELPGSLQGNLVYDQLDEEIRFLYPQGQQNYYELFSSTDQALLYGSGWAQAPEPSSILLLGSGIASLSGFAGQRRLRIRS